MGFWPIVKKVIKDADIVIEVLDSRMPYLSRNLEVERLIEREGKILVKVFTKRDLVSQSFLNKIREEHPDAFYVSGTKNIGLSKLKTELFIIAKRNKIEDPQIGVVGYPNIGKSAIINALSKRSKAAVSRIAGTTKGIQWVKAGSLRVLDSPGVVPLEDDEIKLSLLGAKHPEKIRRPHKVVYEILRVCLDVRKESLEDLYGIKIETDDLEEIIEMIGKKKGYLKKGGVIEENRVFYQLIRDWQDGKIRLR